MSAEQENDDMQDIDEPQSNETNSSLNVTYEDISGNSTFIHFT